MTTKVGRSIKGLPVLFLRQVPGPFLHLSGVLYQGLFPFFLGFGLGGGQVGVHWGLGVDNDSAIVGHSDDHVGPGLGPR